MMFFFNRSNRITDVTRLTHVAAISGRAFGGPMLFRALAVFALLFAGPVAAEPKAKPAKAAKAKAAKSKSTKSRKAAKGKAKAQSKNDNVDLPETIGEILTVEYTEKK